MTQVKKASRPLGKELFEITPIVLGGDPNDPKNKVWLTRQQHFGAVRYWNAIIRKLRSQNTKKSDDQV